MNPGISKTVGLVAGEGELPVAVAEALEKTGARLKVVAFNGLAMPEIAGGGRDVSWIPVGHLQALVDSLKSRGAEDVVLMGRVHIRHIFDPSIFDSRLAALLTALPDRRGSTILKALVGDLEREGFSVISGLEAAPGLVVKPGFIAGPRISQSQIDDVLFGFPIAKKVAELDIGQTVIVKERSVVAVEGMEGTDKAIIRAGELAGGRIVVVKVVGKGHDFNFDVPTVGPRTIRSIVQAGGGAMALEAAKCFLIRKDEVTELCNTHGISLVGVGDGFPEGNS